MITVVIPVSPIKSHPEIGILTETVESVRHHLPDAEIFLTFDGVRVEQKRRRKDYDEAIRRTLEMADGPWHPVVPYIFDKHLHQVGMLRAVLSEVRTPLLMYVEQDTPLVCDEPIDFGAITDALGTGVSSLVRLHHEAVIPDEHRHMMHGHESGYPLLRTSQWSQRPHVAAVAYYRRVLDSYFTQAARSFIEDRMHGVLDESFNVDGVAGWQQHRVHIYDPGNGNMKRSYHTDGRAGEKKYDRQVF